MHESLDQYVTRRGRGGERQPVRGSMALEPCNDIAMHKRRSMPPPCQNLQPPTELISRSRSPIHAAPMETDVTELGGVGPALGFLVPLSEPRFRAP